jgi:NAD(P)H-hydrate epimerase
MLPIIALMSTLPISIHSIFQIRAIEAAVIESGIDAYTLMCRAGQAAFEILRQKWPTARRILVVCGFGNNAGDGYVLAQLAADAGLSVTVVSLVSTEFLRGAAQQAWQAYRKAGGDAQAWDARFPEDADVVVDAILGTGLSRPIDDELQHVINAINSSALPVLSLDVPSGLHAETGQVMGAAIHATHTMSFIGLKTGLYLGEGPDYVGELSLDELSIPSSIFQAAGKIAIRIDESRVKRLLLPRKRTAHKGQFGHVLIIGSGLGMPGAARLAGEACLRVGAGLVTVATRPEYVSSVVAGCPELMVRGALNPNDLSSLFDEVDVIAIGPGLGQDIWAQNLFAAVLATHKPLIVDADALNLLANHPQPRDHWVLTPHPGEAARLLGSNTVSIQAARLQSVKNLADRYGGVVVLKGAGTWVATANELPAVCDRGNPGMAAPGMGDVLTGIIAGIVAQHSDIKSSLWQSACAGVYVHALAGDHVARQGERGMRASDLIEQLRYWVNP